MKKLRNLQTQSGLLWTSLRELGAMTMGVETPKVIAEIEHFLGGIRNEALDAAITEVTETGSVFKCNSLAIGAIAENIRDAKYTCVQQATVLEDK
jgi:hypothetical protein